MLHDTIHFSRSEDFVIDQRRSKVSVHNHMSVWRSCKKGVELSDFNQIS
jgi:hypothetical protein